MLHRLRRLTPPLAGDLALAACGSTIAQTSATTTASQQKSAANAGAIGLLKTVDLTGIYELGLLNDVLKAAGQPEVKGT